jgi:MarR family transcriptional regulator, organic hydroperoxide resistance regulator
VRDDIATATIGASDLAELLRNELRELRIELSVNTRRVAAVSGLKDSDLDVLDVVTREGLHSPTKLARRLTIHVATMTGVLSRLEKAGWVARRRDVVDRRGVQVQSTGFERLAAIYRDANQRLDDIAAQLTPEEGAVIVGYLRQVCAAIHDASMGIAGGQPTS